MQYVTLHGISGQGERTHTARSHAKTKELAFNTLAAC